MGVYLEERPWFGPSGAVKSEGHCELQAISLKSEDIGVIFTVIEV